MFNRLDGDISASQRRPPGAFSRVGDDGWDPHWWIKIRAFKNDAMVRPGGLDHQHRLLAKEKTRSYHRHHSSQRMLSEGFGRLT